MRRRIGIAMTIALLACSSTRPGEPAGWEERVADSRRRLAASGLHRRSHEGTVYWESKSAGLPTLVLLHGVNDQAGSWFEVAELLSKDFQLIVPDLAGHGESEPASGPLTFATMLASVHGLIEHVSPDRPVTIAGNSMGGWLAMLYASQHPARVSRLVLENASGMAWMLSVPLAPKTREEAAQVLRAVHGPAFAVTDAHVDELLTRKETPLSRIDMNDAVAHVIDPKLASLDIPTTLIWGRHDGLLPITYAEALQKKIRNSKLLIIEDAAHIPHLQSPRKFAECLKQTC